MNKQKQIALFDVDGTLTQPREVITEDMKHFMRKLSTHVDIGIVGGSDYNKIKEQLGKDFLDNVPTYVFSENGLVAEKLSVNIGKQSISKFLGEEKLNEIIKFAMIYIAQLSLPFKRGTFVEFRNGMLNISPVGRNCSHEERKLFAKYDREHGILKTFVGVMESHFKEYQLQYSIGGEISFDVFPKGWDKTYCLRFLEEYEVVHFFGDKTHKGGNDHEIYESERTFGHKVTSPEDTENQCTELFMYN